MKLLFYWILCATNCLFFYLEQFMFWAWRSSLALRCFLLPGSPWPAKKLQPATKATQWWAFKNPQKIVLSFPKTFSTVNHCSIFPFLCFHLLLASPPSLHLDCPVRPAWHREGQMLSSATSSHSKPHPCQLHIQYFHLVLSLRIEPSSSACAVRRFHQSEEVEEGEDLDNWVLEVKRDAGKNY